LNIGFGSNLYINNISKIYGINRLELLEQPAGTGQFRRIVPNPESEKVWYDFSNETMYLREVRADFAVRASNVFSPNSIMNNLNCDTFYCQCNAIFNSNLISSNVIASNLTSSNIFTDNLYVHELRSAFFVRSSNIASSNAILNNILNETLTVTKDITLMGNISACNMFTSNLTCVKSITTSNLTSSNFLSEFIRGTSVETTTANIAQTLFANNAVIPTVSGTTYLKSGNFFITPTGIKRDLFGQVTPIIDVSGRYVGKLNLEQIQDLSSLNIEQLVDGKCQVKSVAEPDFDFVLFNPFADLRW
jgi:hypothetical protein